MPKLTRLGRTPVRALKPLVLPSDAFQDLCQAQCYGLDPSEFLRQICSCCWLGLGLFRATRPRAVLFLTPLADPSLLGSQRQGSLQEHAASCGRKRGVLGDFTPAGCKRFLSPFSGPLVWLYNVYLIHFMHNGETLLPHMPTLYVHA